MRRRYILAELHTARREFLTHVKPKTATCALRFNGISTADLTVDASHPAAAHVFQQDCRGIVWLITEDGGTIQKHRLVEGRLGDPYGEGPFGGITVPVIDDFEWVGQTLGWQTPTAAITAQTDEYARYTGPSETRALTVIAANVARLGLPWDVASSAGRGSPGVTELRMHPIADKILAPLTADRLRLRFARNPATDRWDVDVTEGNTYAQPLTPDSGVVASWKWARSRPTATRAAIGGAGIDLEREFDVVVDTARESELDRILEVFVDARMAEAGANLAPYGEEALAAAAAKGSISAVLRDSGWFRFPDAYDLGTRVPVQLGPVEVDDVVTQIDITQDTRNGLRVVPRIGFASSDPNERLVSTVAGLAAGVRTLERR